MTFLALLGAIDAVLRSVGKLQQELDGLTEEQRQAVLDQSWPQIPSFHELIGHLGRWADRLGNTEPERVIIPKQQRPLYAVAALVRKARQELEEVTGPAGADRLTSACGYLQHASRELHVLRWLEPALSPTARDRPLLTDQPLATLLGTVPAPQQLAGSVQVQLPAFLKVRTVPGALETVLYHLLDNAATHAPGAAVSIAARITEETERPGPLATSTCAGPFILITVADSDPGIAEAQRPHIFEQRLSGTGRALHLSRGLWLCRRILRAHSGELWLDQTETGASFTSAWPVSPPQLGDRLKPPAEPWPTDPVLFAKALRYTREASNLTRAQLAALSEVADSSIRNLETGRHKPTRPIRARLITALEEHRQVSGPAVGFLDDNPTATSSKAPRKAD